MGFALNLLIALGSMVILTIFVLPKQEHRISLQIIVLSSISFTHTWNIKKNKETKINEQIKPNKCIDKENRVLASRGAGIGRVKWVKGINCM